MECLRKTKGIVQSIFKCVWFLLIGVMLGYFLAGFQELRHAFDTAQNTVQDVPADTPQTVSMRVTAYCPCVKCCGKSADNITASGHRIQPGDCFAAAPQEYPFGTMVIVPGYNNDRPVPVWDRGGVIKEGRLDVFFSQHKEALTWGVRQLKVEVLK
jgi:3D (Asp-Asp-Asp) domain-containing protein